MKKEKKLIISLSIFMFFILIFSTKVNAASSSISASTTNTTVGNKISITTKINGAAWDVSLTGAISQHYVSNTEDAEDTTKTEISTFTPNSAGKYTITLSGNVTGSNDKSSTKVSDSVTITVTEEAKTTTTPTVSSDATLKNLGIKPNDFSGFKKGTTNYDVKVPNSVDSISIYATVTNSNAKVTGTGKKNLSEGTNKFEVKVTAQDGKTTKTYTLNITRQTAEETNANTNATDNNTTTENTVDTEENTEEVIGLTNLTINGYEISPKFSNSIYEYTATIPKNVTQLDLKTETSGDNIKVDVTGNSELQEGENVITLLVYNSDTDETTTYQIIVTKTNDIDLTTLNSSIDEVNKEYERKMYIILGSIILILIAIIIFVLVKKYIKEHSNSKTNKIKYKRNVDTVDEKERIDLNNEKELFNRVNKENAEDKTKQENESIANTETNSSVEEKEDLKFEKKSQYKEDTELDDFENMDNLEEFLRKRKNNDK